MLAGIIVLVVVIAGGALWYFANLRSMGKRVQPADQTGRLHHQYYQQVFRPSRGQEDDV
jgi:hypothetical protein